MTPSSASAASDSSASASPEWVGAWRVVRYDGEPPAAPTYYDATTESWDVITATNNAPRVAPHPILDIRDDVLVLKDEGAPDAAAERWRVDVTDDVVRVTALTGEHEGAVGIAERIDGDLSERVRPTPDDAGDSGSVGPSAKRRCRRMSRTRNRTVAKCGERPPVADRLRDDLSFPHRPRPLS